MKRWEYKTIIWDAIDDSESYSIKNSLDEYGSQGWELVSAITQVESRSNEVNFVEAIGTTEVILFFKREY